jgi:hypothetical protein
LERATTVRDVDKTPPRPYSSGELEAARPSLPVQPVIGSRSGKTKPGGYRPPSK